MLVAGSKPSNYLGDVSSPQVIRGGIHLNGSVGGGRFNPAAQAVATRERRGL